MIHWSDLTDVEKKHFQMNVTNGCGPQNIPVVTTFLQKYFFGRLLKANCVQHDFYYMRGGNICDKFKADLLMYRYSFKDCITHKSIILFLIATVYFLGVSIFGLFYFHFGVYKTKGEILTVSNS